MRSLGIAPVVVGVGAGSGIEAAWAWYDPDVFEKLWVDADLDRKVEQLNNYWQLLHRSAMNSGLSQRDAAVQNLNIAMERWWQWKQDYGDAIFRRALSFGFSDWEDELDDYWHPLFHRHVAQLTKAAGRRFEEQLASRGVDPEYLDPSSTVLEDLEEVASKATLATARASRTAFFWPFAVMGVAALGTIWLVTRSRR